MGSSRLSTRTGQTAGKPGLSEKSFSSDQGKEPGPWKRGQVHSSKDRTVSWPKSTEWKAELVGFRKHSLFHPGDTRSDLWKDLENPAELDFCV